MFNHWSRFSGFCKNLSFALKSYEPALPLRKNLFGYSDAARKVFNQQLKNVDKNTDDVTNFKSAHAVVKEIISDENLFFPSSFLSERNKELLEFTNLGGNGCRNKILLNTYKTVAQNSALTKENILRASIMGYLTEVLNSSILIIDDMMDGSEQRRNKLCWYKKVGVGLASNDSLILISSLYLTMKEIFQNQPYYESCLKNFQDACWIVANSLPLDFHTLQVLTKHEENCTWQVYKHLCFSGITSTSVYLPVMAAMNMAAYDTINHHSSKINKIMNDMGYYIKLENDYSDRYGSGTGKVLDEDIRVGKLTWLLLTTLDHVNEQQRNTLKECYGKHDDKYVNVVVDIYEQIGIRKIHKTHTHELLNSITEDIKSIPDKKVQKVLFDILNMFSSWYKYKDDYVQN